MEQSGQPYLPITLQGANTGSIIEGGNTALTLKGNHWVLKGFSITRSQIGLLITGSNNFIDSLVTRGISTAMMVQGSDNNLKSCAISSGERGIIVDGSRNKLNGLSINVHNPALFISEHSCCGTIKGMVLNGKGVVRGHNHFFKSCVANRGLDIHGCGNSFKSNVVHGFGVTQGCENYDKGGNVLKDVHNLPSE